MLWLFLLLLWRGLAQLLPDRAIAYEQLHHVPNLAPNPQLASLGFIIKRFRHGEGEGTNKGTGMKRKEWNLNVKVEENGTQEENPSARCSLQVACSLSISPPRSLRTRIGQTRVQDDKKDEDVAEDSAHRAASAL